MMNPRENLKQAGEVFRRWDLLASQDYPGANEQRNAAYQIWIAAVEAFNKWRHQ